MSERTFLNMFIFLFHECSTILSLIIVLHSSYFPSTFFSSFLHLQCGTVATLHDRRLCVWIYFLKCMWFMSVNMEEQYWQGVSLLYWHELALHWSLSSKYLVSMECTKGQAWRLNQKLGGGDIHFLRFLQPALYKKKMFRREFTKNKNKIKQLLHIDSTFVTNNCHQFTELQEWI